MEEYKAELGHAAKILCAQGQLSVYANVTHKAAVSTNRQMYISQPGWGVIHDCSLELISLLAKAHSMHDEDKMVSKEKKSKN